VLLDENQQDTILQVVPEEGFSGGVVVAVTARDGSGGLESIEFRFDHLGKNYDPITVPNVITPNNDQINDRLTIRSDDYLELFDITIYNRWGTKVHEASAMSQAWDGQSNNTNIAPGVYYYTIKTETICGPLTKAGAIHVIH
jgi:gliding motility-associated-like protein